MTKGLISTINLHHNTELTNKDTTFNHAHNSWKLNIMSDWLQEEEPPYQIATNKNKNCHCQDLKLTSINLHQNTENSLKKKHNSWKLNNMMSN